MNAEESIRNNISEVMKRVEKAAEKSGRKLEDITVVAVTKTVEPERILKAVDCGMLDLGENRVQELCEKYDIIGKECRWHLIGHLQTNKVKYIIDKVRMIHSVDSLELAAEIQKRAQKANCMVDILAQVNVADEETKFGIPPEQAVDFVKQLGAFPNIRVKGLMTIAPFAENPEDIRYVFRQLHEILIDIKRKNIDNINMTYLSMGMSNDFEIAIEEGSNMVRIGSAIFGKRQYNK